MMYDLTLPVMVSAAGAVVFAAVYVMSRDRSRFAVPGWATEPCRAAHEQPWWHIWLQRRYPRTCGHEGRQAVCPRPKGAYMDNAAPAAPPAPPASSPPPRRRPGAGALLTLINGVLAGVDSVYVGTHSVLITVIAAVVAVVFAVMVLAFQR
jgi:hypothetical protein